MPSHWEKTRTASRFTSATSGPRKLKSPPPLRRGHRSEGFRKEYAAVSEGDASWQGLSFPTGDVYQWEPDSTYIRKAPYFDGMSMTPAPVTGISGARVLAVLGDSVTTDHISPAGSIKANGPAGKYLAEHGVKPADFNSYGSRRGNHEVMVRGTFANVRLRNKLAPGTEGGVTRLLPEGEQMSIFDASVKYAERGVPTIILAGKEYGSGSSRDWAAKGPKLLGVRAVIAESFERIHRSNLVGMGILPLQFEAGQNVESLGLTGEEVYDFPGLTALLKEKFANGRTLGVKATRATAKRRNFTPWCASTRRRRSNTTSTAAFCNTCCGSWRRSSACHGCCTLKPPNAGLFSMVLRKVAMRKLTQAIAIVLFTGSGPHVANMRTR